MDPRNIQLGKTDFYAHVGLFAVHQHGQILRPLALVSMSAKTSTTLLSASAVLQKDKSKTMADITTFPFIVTEHTIDGQHIREYPNATVDPNSTFKLVVKKYTPVDNPNPEPGDVTIIGAHGCGFPKVSRFNPILHATYLRSALAKER